MKLLSFYAQGELHLGVKKGVKILDATTTAPHDIPRSMAELLRQGERGRQALAAWADKHENEPGLDEEQLSFAPCVPFPGKIIGVGLNYHEYLEKLKTAKPAFPHLFPKFPCAVRGSGKTVSIPANSQQVDFEAELAVVIGRRARMADEENALDYVLGYCCANDITARDFQSETTSWMPGKCCDGFIPIGPYLVTADEIKNPGSLAVKARVNGELRQSFTTSDMIRSVKYLISGISRYFTLDPGDILLTGTSVGHIMCDSADKRRWLSDGDVVAVEVEGLGRLVTPFKNERI